MVLVAFAECVNVALPGLSGYVKDEWFKLYLSDVGLLMSMYGTFAKRSSRTAETRLEPLPETGRTATGATPGW